LKEENAAGSGAAEPSAPPYEDKFSHKIKIQFKDNLDSDLVSHEEGQEDTAAHQALGAMHLGFPPWVKRFPSLTKSPLQAALQAAVVKERIQLVFNFTLGLRDQTLTTLACNRDFMKRFHLKL
jgi:hypothetical protein